MTYYPIRLPIKAWQYLGDGFGAQSFQDWIAAEIPQYIYTIKYKELRQPSLLSITFPIGDTELYFDMVALNNSNANVFYWPLSTGNKINTSYHIVPKLAKFFIDTINDCPEITLKGYDKILFKYRDKLYYFYAGEYLLYSQERFYFYSRKAYEALH